MFLLEGRREVCEEELRVPSLVLLLELAGGEGHEERGDVNVKITIHSRKTKLTLGIELR